MTDSTMPDEWIQIWLSDQSTTCVANTPVNRALLDDAIETRGVGAVDLVTLDGAPCRVRRIYIAGYVVSTPAARVVSRQFKKLREAEDEDEDETNVWKNG